MRFCVCVCEPLGSSVCNCVYTSESPLRFEARGQVNKISSGTKTQRYRDISRPSPLRAHTTAGPCILKEIPVNETAASVCVSVFVFFVLRLCFLSCHGDFSLVSWLLSHRFLFGRLPVLSFQQQGLFRRWSLDSLYSINYSACN